MLLLIVVVAVVDDDVVGNCRCRLSHRLCWSLIVVAKPTAITTAMTTTTAIATTQQ